MLAENIWSYISIRVDNDSVLPSEDEIYTEFVHYFEALGFNADVIAEVVESYCGCSDLSGVDIHWEGEIPWKPYKELLRIENTTSSKSKLIS